MAGPGTKHFAALMMTLLVLTACHWDQYTKPDLTILLASVENSFSATSRQREIPLVDETFLSEFPFRSSVAALTEEVTPEMISPELPLPPRVIFTMPLRMDVNCLSSTCGDGIQLSGNAEMIVDLDQRQVTLHQFDLRDSSYKHHLSGMMQLHFDDFGKRENALSKSTLSLATPDRVFQFDSDATLLLHEVDLENSHAIIDFEASMTDDLFLSGSGITTGNELE